MSRLTLPLLLQAVSILHAQPVTEVDRWIKANAIPLSTVEAGHGFSDLQPLKKIIGDARIVSLGEATHGTREFFQLKHRMVEFLASEMGFTIFSIEANMPEAYRLNDYVLNGTGDPAELLRGMYFWTWNTKEVLAMIEWMREFNKSGKGRIEFTGFDMQTPEIAAGIVRDFAVKNEPALVPEIAKVPLPRVPTAPANKFASYTGTFPIEDAAGKIVRFSANIRTENVTGYAGLWWRADTGEEGKLKPAAFKNLGNAAPKGTTDRQHYELEMEVPPDTRNINFGPLLAGAGTAWFDDLAVTINDVPYAKAQGFHLVNHAPELPKGIFPVTPGYVGEIINDTLRVTRIAPLEAPATDTTKEAVANWKRIFDSLQSRRAAYLARGVTPKDADWVIQNARIVIQCMQMRSNEVSRDRAMAENVKWILDHNPQAKIVLWAHNGHVGTRSYGPQQLSMGQELRSIYGDQMRVFGFAFNRGSFQAIEQSKGLRNFTVSAAPEQSLDAALARSGVPLLALDFQHAPAGSAAAQWLKAPQQTRSIGAVYFQDRPEQFFNKQSPQGMFDAILFVENTTAAIPNPSSAGPPDMHIVSCTGAPVARCVDDTSKVAFKLPQGWTVRNSGRWGDRQNTIQFTDPLAIPGENPSLFYQPNAQPLKLTPEELAKKYRDAADAKVRSRQGAFPDYHLRPDSCHARQVNGRPAWSCVAEFTQGDLAVAEYLTWIHSDNAEALYFGFVSQKSLEPYIQGFDKVIDLLELP